MKKRIQSLDEFINEKPTFLPIELPEAIRKYKLEVERYHEKIE